MSLCIEKVAAYKKTVLAVVFALHLHSNRHVRERTHTHTHTHIHKNASTHTHTHGKSQVLIRLCKYFQFLAIPIRKSL